MTECVRINASMGNSPVAGVLHIGAHLGEEAQAYAETGTIKSVAWIEGNKFLMKDLYDSTRAFSSAFKQQFYNEVLSDTDGDRILFNITNNGQSSSILPLGTHKQHHPQVSVVETREVITSRFDTLCGRAGLNLSIYDFINLDIQGAELKALKGFGDLLKRCPFKMIYCEVNKEHLYEGCCLVEELDEYLFQFGFTRVMTKWTEYQWGDSVYARKV